MAKYAELLPRFLKYVRVETRSDPESSTIPSTPKETAFLQRLATELQDIGLSDVRINPKNSYLLATIPSNLGESSKIPTIG